MKKLILSNDAVPGLTHPSIHPSLTQSKVLNIGYRDRIGWGFFISDIGGDIGDTRTYPAFISDTVGLVS